MTEWESLAMGIIGVVVIALLFEMKAILNRMHQVLKEMHETVKWGLAKDIQQNQSQHFKNELDSVLMKSKIKEAKKKAGESYSESDE